jgi:hypothetical protein
MRIQVEAYEDERGIERLRRFWFDNRVIEVANNIDQWHGTGYRYVKVGGRDGSTYILRRDEIRAEWELTMYQAPRFTRRSPEHRSPRSAI